jgi:hypothetical protein
MIDLSSSLRIDHLRRLRRLRMGVTIVALALGPACFRGVETSKMVCGDDEHCPSGYQCKVDPSTRQGRCKSTSVIDASGTLASEDAPLSGGTAGRDAPSGQGGTPATGGASGASGIPGSGGSTSSTASGGTVATGGMPATGGILGSGGTVDVGGTSGLVTGLGGAGGQTGPFGTGGQGPAGGSGGSAACPVAGQKLCGTACVDPQTDNSNCGGCGTKCDPGQRCSVGSCTCDKTSCPGGCCADKNCVDLSEQWAPACGKPGTACVACPSDSTCNAGECVCRDKLTMCPATNTCSDLQTDKDHCGSCSKTCADGCAAGRCFTKIVELTAYPDNIAVDATHVYFTMQHDISRVPRNGGAVQVLAMVEVMPQRIALDGNNVYWIDWGTGNGGSNLDGSVMKVPLAGGTPVSLATMEPYPQELAVDASNVYWTNALGPGLAEGAVMKVPIAGGSKVVLASSVAYQSPRGIAVDSSAVYWVNQGEAASPGSIMKVPLTGGTAVTLVSKVTFPVHLALSNGMIYFTCWESNAGVEKVSTAGGVLSMVWPTPLDATAGILADAKSLYLAQGFQAQSALVKIDLNTGVSTPITPLAQAIALDDSNLFWVTNKSINVMPKVP